MGHVQKCYYHPIKKAVYFVESQVLQSQRVSDSSNMYNVWVRIHKKQRYIPTANFACMTGLWSSCSHDCPFFLNWKNHSCLRNRWHFSHQYSLSMEVNKEVSRNSPSHKNLINLINFSRLKKEDLPSVPSLTWCYVKNFLNNSPTAGEISLTKEELKRLVQHKS